MSDLHPDVQQQLDDRVSGLARAKKHAADLTDTPEGDVWAEKVTSLQAEIDHLRQALGQ